MSSDIRKQEAKNEEICVRNHQHPRLLLPCLHSFCASCIEAFQEPDDSGNVIRCPTCHRGHRVEVRDLPTDYTAVIELPPADDERRCDLCSDHRTRVTLRCVDCSASVCDFCAEAHRRQTRTKSHRVLPRDQQDSLPAKVTKRSSDVPCVKHRNEKLELFCETCAMTACRLCCSKDHRNHCCRFIADVNGRHLDRLKQTVDQVIKPLMDNIDKDLTRLTIAGRNLEEQTSHVAQEVDHHVEKHQRIVKDHGQALLDKVMAIREGRDQSLEVERKRLEHNAEELRSAVRFAERLLRHDSAAEALSLLAPVTDRLLDLRKQYQDGTVSLTTCLREPFVRFSPTQGFPVSGQVSDRDAFGVCASNCVLRAHPGLHDVIQGRNTQATVLAMDSDCKPVTEGGALLTARMLAAERLLSGCQVPVKVCDTRDGIYALSFSADRSGRFTLHVKIDGIHIQGSPFDVTVRPPPSSRPHSGTFHCCAFCSGGGSKDARCACGGRMPGGYMGCGHSHGGHPGRKHWSCCGNPLRKSFCSRPVSIMYQFTI